MAVRAAGLPKSTSVVSCSSSPASRLGGLIDRGEDLSSYSAVIGEGLRALVQSSGDLSGQAFSNALLKRDLAAGTVQAHQFGRDPTVGETVFAPATPTPPKTTATLWPSSNPNRSAADLVILAAQDFSGQPVACVRMLARSRPASTAAGSPTSNPDEERPAP